MFGSDDFGEGGKKKVENRRENGWEGCLVGRGRRRENWWAPGVFSLDPPKLNLSKMERKFKLKWGSVFWTKLLFPQQPATNNFLFFCFCLFLLLSSLAGLDFFFSTFFLFLPFGFIRFLLSFFWLTSVLDPLARGLSKSKK